MMALVQCRTKISECCLGDKTVPETFYGVAFSVKDDHWDNQDANDGIESNQRA